MEISKERIAEFKKLFQEKSEREITDAEAYEGTHNLVGLFFNFLAGRFLGRGVWTKRWNCVIP